MVRVARKEIDLRETILDAAEALLGRTGFRKTTMEEIAREAGIGKGTTYLYFPSKDEVFLATIDRIADRLCDRLRAIAGEPAALDERLRRMLVEATNALLPYALSPRELGDRDEVARRAARVARAIVSGVLTPSEPTSRRTRRGAER